MHHKNHRFEDTIIREYDIRGIYNNTLKDNDAKILGNLFGLELGEDKFVNVAYDGRVSSKNLKKHLIDGLVEVGVNVNEIGLSPTPLLYYSCYDLNADGGIIVTGSHNPKDHNGFKIVKNNKPFFGNDLIKLKKKALKFKFKKKEGKVKTISITERYISRLLKNFDQKKEINIVWDSGNGAAGNIVEKLSTRINGKTQLLFCEIDGNFPNHHPDPSEEKNLIFCREKLLELNFDVGFAFDGDGDRLGVIDNLGRPVSGDKLLLILSNELLKKKKAKIIADVKCSQVLFDEIKRNGGDPIMSATGHSHVKNNLKKFNADLAGEMSGHIFFADKYYGFDDAFYAAIKVIELIINNKKQLSQLVDEIPKSFNTPEIRIDCDDKKKFKIISQVVSNQKRKKKKIIDIDGVRVIEDDGWWLLRASNTQAALVLRCESKTKKGLEDQKKKVVRELSLVDSDLSEKIFS